MAIYEKFIGRDRDSFASLKDAQENYRINCPPDFNFAYDVIDVLGREKPGKRALVWLGSDGTEKTFTFGDLSRESDRAANYLYSMGIRKGDRVLLVLERHYIFWILLLALSKIGAVMVQATSMLMAKDYIYRRQCRHYDDAPLVRYAKSHLKQRRDAFVNARCVGNQEHENND